MRLNKENIVPSAWISVKATYVSRSELICLRLLILRKKKKPFLYYFLLVCVLPSCLPHWLWMFSSSMLGWEYHFCSSQLSSEGQRRCLKIPLQFAESDSEFPATASFYNSSLPCWPKYLPFLKHTNYICDANIAPACVWMRFIQAELLPLAYFSE